MLKIHYAASESDQKRERGLGDNVIFFFLLEPSKAEA